MVPGWRVLLLWVTAFRGCLHCANAEPHPGAIGSSRAGEFDALAEQGGPVDPGPVDPGLYPGRTVGSFAGPGTLTDVDVALDEPAACRGVRTIPRPGGGAR